MILFTPNFTESPAPSDTPILTSTPEPTIPTPTSTEIHFPLTTTGTGTDELAWEWIDLPMLESVIEAPEGWTLTEINRRPLQGYQTPIFDHDCADYLLADPTRKYALLIEMVCVPRGAVGVNAQPGTYLIAELEDGNILGRFPNDGKITFTECVLDTGVDPAEVRQILLCSAPPFILLRNLRMFLVVTFIGPEEGFSPEVLSTSDRIVFSLVSK
jgi:hypothetical protein